MGVVRSQSEQHQLVSLWVLSVHRVSTSAQVEVWPSKRPKTSASLQTNDESSGDGSGENVGEGRLVQQVLAAACRMKGQSASGTVVM